MLTITGVQTLDFFSVGLFFRWTFFPLDFFPLDLFSVGLFFRWTFLPLDFFPTSQSMLTHNLKSLENMPPTKGALYQHIKRTILVTAYIWHVAFRKMLETPPPGSYGWEWNERFKQWAPYWTELDDASKACSILLHCGCKKSCSGNCKCAKAGKRCTALCKCEAGCIRS